MKLHPKYTKYVKIRFGCDGDWVLGIKTKRNEAQVAKQYHSAKSENGAFARIFQGV
jgi:hypothetical protein